MKKIILLVFSVIHILSAQPVEVEPYIDATGFIHGHVFDPLNGLGYNPSTFTMASDIVNSNPSAITEFDGINIGISYLFESKIDPAWFVDITHERGYLYLPQSFGLVIPFDYLNLGIGFAQIYNSEAKFGGLDITTINNPEGTGEAFEASDISLVNRYSVIAAKKIINDPHSLCLNVGIQLSLDQLFYESYILKTSLTANGFGFSWKIGANIDIENQHFLGIHYESGFDITSTANMDNRVSTIDTSLRGDNFYIISDSWDVRAKSPSKFSIGYRLDISDFGFSLEYSKLFWNNLNTEFSNNDLVSGSLYFSLIEDLTFSIGIIGIGSHRGNISFFSNFEENLKSKYLYGGIMLQLLDHYKVNFIYANGHAYSGEWRKSNLIKISISTLL